ncbi:MAG: S26 family signal peptidase [Bdellovibrionales bacterium]
MNRFSRKYLVRLAAIAIFGILIFNFVLHPFVVQTEGPSGGIRLRFANMLAYRLGEPSVGDVVVLKILGKESMMAAQIIGTPGQKIDIIGKDLFVDGDLYPLLRLDVREKRYDGRVLKDNEVMLISLTEPPTALGILNMSKIIGKLL